jgi:hypothetical protein
MLDWPQYGPSKTKDGLYFVVYSETGHINMKKQTLFFYYKKQQSLFSILENDFKYMRVYLATLIS